MSQRTVIERPPPPRPPRPLFLPIALGLMVVFVGIMVPLLNSEPEHEEEPAEPAAPEQATLTVRTVPEGATVFVGSESRGTSPLDLTLDVGETVTLRVEKEGFLQAERELTPEPGMAPLDVQLEAAPYVLAVAVTPEDAEPTIMVNGESPADPAAIALGAELTAPLEITIEARGFRPFVTMVDPSSFVAEAERRFHRLEVELESRRSGRRTPRTSSAAMSTAMTTMAAPTPEPPSSVPANPF